jgi:hypothetical protein
VNDAGFALFLAGESSLPAVFGCAVLALRASVGEVVRNAAKNEYRAAIRICTFLSLVKAFHAAFFTGNGRNRSCHRVKTLLSLFEVLLFTHLVFGVAGGIAAFDPGQLAGGDGIYAGAAAAPAKGNQAGYRQAHYYNADHNRFFPAAFHIEISKLPDNNATA